MVASNEAWSVMVAGFLALLRVRVFVTLVAAQFLC